LYGTATLVIGMTEELTPTLYNEYGN
jgi:hypothetical protein